MSVIATLEKSKSLIETTKVSFSAMAKIHGAVEFEREASFAMQALGSNSFLLETATKNPDSLKQAVLNIAAIGLSLSPVHKFAYLVPRDGKVMLDLSYKGLTQLAIDAKSVMWVQAELVYQKDVFTLRGRGQEPLHERNPFDKERGDVVGAYCVAKTFDGEFLVEAMSADEIFDIRDRTQAYKAYQSGKVKSCPWVSDPGEMFKKTVIRRASKSWPMTDTRVDSRFEKAISVYDGSENVDLNAPPLIGAPAVDLLPAKIEEIKKLLVTLNRKEENFLGYLEGANSRKIETLNDLSLVEADGAIVFLNQLILKEEKKKAKVKNENA